MNSAIKHLIDEYNDLRSLYGHLDDTSEEWFLWARLCDSTLSTMYGRMSTQAIAFRAAKTSEDKVSVLYSLMENDE
jgi:hypothetical protein